MTDAELDESRHDSEPARLADFVLFFFGQRDSILRMVDSKGGLLFSATLVMSAAFAREYDAESLVHEPWHLLGPFGASIILASVLFVITQWCQKIDKQQIKNAIDDYRAFLTGYWLTAPLAWLYALPVESMTDEVTAVKYNLTALSVVSVWRVALFTRVVSVRFRLPYWIALVWIGLPCAVIGFVAAMQASLAIVPIMGGLQLTETQAVLHGFQSAVSVILFYAIPVLFVAWIVSIVRLKKRSPELEHAPASRHRLSRILWAIPVAALLLFVWGAWRFQPPLYRAAVVDQFLMEEKLDEAVSHLMKRQRSDYPPIWDPPPKSALGESPTPPLDKLIDQLIASDAPQWINDLLLHRAAEIMLRQNGIWRTWDLGEPGRFFRHYPEEKVQQIGRTLNKLQQVETSDAADRERQIELLESVRQWRPPIETEEDSRQLEVDGAAESP